MPRAVAALRSVRVRCRRSVGTASPTQMSPDGTTAAMHAPVSARATTSSARVGASTEASPPTAARASVTRMVRTRPMRSLSRPHAGWLRP